MVVKKVNSGFNFRLVSRVQGGLLVIESLFFLLCMAMELYYKEDIIYSFLVPFVVSISLGFAGLWLGRGASTTIGKREGAIIVTMTWVICSLIGMLPYIISGFIPSVSDAFFETMSGFTTTGATILTDIEVLPRSLLFWRSTTHWVGGLGIIVITMALLPIFGFNGSLIYSAEVTGIGKDVIHPKVSGTAKRLLLIYLILTIVGIVGLWLAGMTPFDAVNHSFSSVSTGGFSTKNSSIAFWSSPSIDWVIISLMLLSGVNLSLYYFVAVGRFKRILKDEELRTFVLIMLVSAAVMTIVQRIHSNMPFVGLGKAIRDSVFTITSLLTTTGFCSVDYSVWEPIAFILMLVSIIGGSAGSTAGGSKVIRVLLVVKYCYFECKRMIHPNAYYPVRYNGKLIRNDIVTRMLAFLFIYVIILFVGSAVLSLSGIGFAEAMSGMIASLSNVGPAWGKLGPVFNYAGLSDFAKWFLSFVMMVGRLELFTVIVIFTPAFWKR